MPRVEYSSSDRIKAFWNKVVIIPFHECWEWSGFKSKLGYAKFNHGKNNSEGQLAHRFSLSLTTFLIPGMVVDHTCRNKGCVNPAHLRQVTHQINSLENSSAMAYFNSLKTHCPKGHEYTPSNTGSQNTKNRRGRYCKICKNISMRKSVKKFRDKIGRT